MGARSRILLMRFARFSPVFASRAFDAFLSQCRSSMGCVRQGPSTARPARSKASAKRKSSGRSGRDDRADYVVAGPSAIARLVLLGACVIPLFAAGHAAADTTKTSDSRRAAASAQFERAEEQRSALNEKPANKRTLAEYKNVVTTYRRVFLITPRAPEVPESLSAVGQLYTEMGDRFGRSC